MSITRRPVWKILNGVLRGGGLESVMKEAKNQDKVKKYTN